MYAFCYNLKSNLIIEIRGVKMFAAILINIIIVLVAIFIPALVKALMNKSGWDFIENIDESKKVTPVLLLLILVGKDLHIQKI